MNNGIIFGTQGPVMSGTWYNPTTGDSFTVMDSFFENNQYVVKTTDNRILSYEVIQNYVQSDKPIAMLKKQQDELPAEVANLIADDTIFEAENNGLFVDTDIYGVNVNNPLTPSLGNINKPLPYSVQEDTPPFNVGIIKKALDKYTRPQVDCSIAWDNFPKKEIQMLNEIMEIDTKEIVEWYASQLDTTEIAIAIHNSIVSYINDQLYGRVEDKSGVVEVNDVDAHTYTQTSLVIDDTPKTPKKSTPKKTTKKTKK